MIKIEDTVTKQAQSAKLAAGRLAHVSTVIKNQILEAMANALQKHEHELLAANAIDMENAQKAGLSAALCDRLKLNTSRIISMADGLRTLAALPDPVGHELEHFTLKNGLDVLKVSVPLGVLGFIYEARPNVTADAIGLALKSGNAIILKGGKEAIHSNRAIVAALTQALNNIVEDPILKNAVQFIDSTERTATYALLNQHAYVDLIIPRGGKTLIQAVMEQSRIPVLQHLDGICHVYVDAAADLAMAQDIVINAKCQRPGVCNAMETLLVHAQIAPTFLPQLAELLHQQNVEMRGCKRTQVLLKDFPVVAATEEDCSTEYQDLILAIKIIDSLDEAIEHINTYGSHHSDSIITANAKTADHFLRFVESAVVYHNASTRFTDGSVFGFGAEMGISTGKLHARGPVGLKELTTYQYRVQGNGQIRN